ncbi:MAG TPA: TetR/AcrR family transcriptional regulator [Acidimicrobiales bacterium]
MESPGAASRRERRSTGDGPEARPRRRADAERNIAAILDAALACLSSDPQATMADIARAAGVGRVTLYAHFSSREVLLEAALDRAVAEVVGASRAIDAEVGDLPADEVLRRHVRSSWWVLDRYRQLFEAAQRSLPPGRLRDRHTPALGGFDELLARGRAEGVFRADLPVDWLVSVIYSLFHAAAADVNAGVLPREDAAGVIEATLLPMLARR